MSTKTTIKRIALVAVAALGLGTVSTVAANAAAGFNATYTAPSSLKLLTGYAATDAGTIQVDLAGGGAYGALTTSDSATVTLTANDGAVAKDATFLAALTLSTSNTGASADYSTASTGYNVLNNGTVAISGSNKVVSVTTTTAGYASASGKVYIKVATGLTSASSGAKVKYTLTTSSNGVIQTFASTLTLTIDASAGTATTPVTTGTITAGGTATATYTQPYTNVPASSTISPTAFALTTTVASGTPTFNVTGVATGGSVSLVRTDASTITPSIQKNALDGDLSVTYTLTVTAPATAAAGETISLYGYTWTVQPYTPAYSYSTVTPTAGSNGYYASAADGGDGIVWGIASEKTASTLSVSVVQKDQNNATITAVAYAKTVSATITGKGSLSSIASTADVVVKSKAWSVSNGQLTNGTTTIAVYSDGTSGEGTLTIAVDGATVKTYTLRWLGDAATVKATLVRPIGSTSSAANGSAGTAPASVTNNIGGTTKTVDADSAPAVAVTVLDSNGWAIPTSTAPSVAISDVTVVQSAARQFIDSGISVPASLKFSAGTFVQHYLYTTNTNTSGKTATLTFNYVNAAGTALSSTPVTVTLGGAVVKSTLTLDENSYRPGQVVTLTFAGFDASGNKAYDGQDLIAGGFTSSLDFGGNNSISDSSGNGYFSSAKIVNGVKVRTTYAPVVPGAWSLEAATASGVAASASATVEDPSAAAQDAANEATDAANAATDAANAAAEAADAATAAAQDAQAAVAELATKVASLIAGIKAQITTLTNLVIKIQKKVRA